MPPITKDQPGPLLDRTLFWLSIAAGLSLLALAGYGAWATVDMVLTAFS